MGPFEPWVFGVSISGDAPFSRILPATGGTRLGTHRARGNYPFGVH